MNTDFYNSINDGTFGNTAPMPMYYQQQPNYYYDNGQQDAQTTFSVGGYNYFTSPQEPMYYQQPVYQYEQPMYQPQPMYQTQYPIYNSQCQDTNSNKPVYVIQGCVDEPVYQQPMYQYEQSMYYQQPVYQPQEPMYYQDTNYQQPQYTIQSYNQAVQQEQSVQQTESNQQASDKKSIFGGDYDNPYAGVFAPYKKPQPYYGDHAYPGVSYNNYNGNGGVSRFNIQYPYRASSKFRNQQMQEINMAKEAEKMKYRLCAAFNGREINEEALENMIEMRYNPNAMYERMSPEERNELMEWNQVVQLSRMANDPYHVTKFDIQAMKMRERSANYHEELDNHSLAEFLDNDLWKLQREDWIAKYVDRHARRDLRRSYNPAEYGDLLKSHITEGSFISELMKNDRNDGFYEDENGVTFELDKDTNTLRISRPPLPESVSSEAVQKSRREWTKYILDGIYNKP